MNTPPFLTRVLIRNFKSIAACDAGLRPLTILLGPNGGGKSNFLDALRFVTDGLRTSLEHAFRERGGINEVRRRSAGHPTHLGIRLEFALPAGATGFYGFRIGAKPVGGYEVVSEECVVHPPEALAGEARFVVNAGEVSGTVPGPAASSDRLYLVSASGLREFRPVYDALSEMGFYNANPDRIKDLQLPDAGDRLARDGSNMAAALDRIGRIEPEVKMRIEGLLARIVPGIRGVDRVALGPRDTLQFRQDAGPESEWRFLAASMSDGALRALGTLAALFQTGEMPLVGVDDADAGLDPAGIAVLLEAMGEVSGRRQVIAVSHAPGVLDGAPVAADSVLAVVADTGSTFAGPLDAVGREALKRRLNKGGVLLRAEREKAEEGDTGQLRLMGEASETK
ncbi:MAG: AAA family ATPase [Acidobacteriia bacterium]|nr:AAA family ATPase [Terriglobia bacterium]